MKSEQIAGRREFLRRGALMTALAMPLVSWPADGADPPDRTGNALLKLSLNAYSFNIPLREGRMDLFDLLDYCAEHGYDALDPTGYYFPGYPDAPPDNFVYEFKRRAAVLGIEFSGTGIRNDFTVAEPAQRMKDIELVRRWALVASKAGIPVLRLFAGRNAPVGRSREDITDWMIEDFRTCAEIGRDHGIMMALQNHNDFLKTADQTAYLLESVDSKWFGLHLDIGSFSVHDPYEEIRKVVPYAINWQIKEQVWMKGTQVPTDLEKVFRIARSAGYRGYLPLETLGADAVDRLPAFHRKARGALRTVSG